LHDAGAILLVTPGAVADDRALGDRESSRRVGRRPTGATIASGSATATTSALRAGHGERQRQRREQHETE
jgi:hypothetical protein